MKAAVQEHNCVVAWQLGSEVVLDNFDNVLTMFDADISCRSSIDEQRSCVHGSEYEDSYLIVM